MSGESIRYSPETGPGANRDPRFTGSDSAPVAIEVVGDDYDVSTRWPISPIDELAEEFTVVDGAEFRPLPWPPGIDFES